jgi:hypothetical protein
MTQSVKPRMNANECEFPFSLKAIMAEIWCVRNGFGRSIDK